MDIHVCKHCGSHFVYCRQCVFKPIRYKDAGFCSKECYEASKIEIPQAVEVEEILAVETEEVVIDNEISEEEILIEIESYENEIEDEGLHE